RPDALGAVALDDHALDLAIHERIGEKIAHVWWLVGVGYLGLHPDLAIGQRPHIDAAVVIFLVLHRPKTPLDVKDAVGPVAVVEEHLLDADALTAQRWAVRIQLPGILGAELRVGSDRDTL